MNLFKKRPRIVSITSTSSGDFLFVFGLGSDGACYVWHSATCEWMLHKAVNPEPPAEVVPGPPKRKK